MSKAYNKHTNRKAHLAAWLGVDTWTTLDSCNLAAGIIGILVLLAITWSQS